jgi:hypothetical protein
MSTRVNVKFADGTETSQIFSVRDLLIFKRELEAEKGERVRVKPVFPLWLNFVSKIVKEKWSKKSIISIRIEERVTK